VGQSCVGYTWLAGVDVGVVCVVVVVSAGDWALSTGDRVGPLRVLSNL
jgi:hypothetical protein